MEAKAVVVAVDTIIRVVKDVVDEEVVNGRTATPKDLAPMVPHLPATALRTSEVVALVEGLEAAEAREASGGKGASEGGAVKGEEGASEVTMGEKAEEEVVEVL